MSRVRYVSVTCVLFALLGVTCRVVARQVGTVDLGFSSPFRPPKHPFFRSAERSTSVPLPVMPPLSLALETLMNLIPSVSQDLRSQPC